jgi:hypothetical protein
VCAGAGRRWRTPGRSPGQIRGRQQGGVRRAAPWRNRAGEQGRGAGVVRFRPVIGERVVVEEEEEGARGDLGLAEREEGGMFWLGD